MKTSIKIENLRKKFPYHLRKTLSLRNSLILRSNRNRIESQNKVKKESNSYYLSPLRYPGGKSSLLDFLTSIIHFNAPIVNYIEPFAGGAGAALGLLFRNEVQRIFLNDADDYIHKFWNSILNQNSEFIQRIEDSKINIEQYLEYKELLNKKNTLPVSSDLDIGFAFFFLNRCNRSGILRSGPIGGYSQNGKWKIDARFNKPDLIKRISLISKFKDRIQIYNLDAIDFLRDVVPNLGLDLTKTISYLDPPYYVAGPDLYRIFYRKTNHEDLRTYLKEEFIVKWILSYDDDLFIRDLYDGTRINGFSKNHFANKAKIGKELIIASDNCNLFL